MRVSIGGLLLGGVELRLLAADVPMVSLKKYKEDGRSSALVLASIALAFQQERSGAHLVETPSDEP